ncbi:carbamoyltransferase family protein [Phytoactinopolyspora halotolerans]|uniref:Carbamoyltransferase n=1 Tax=Phytoactinopolyspora halotolerans TaxID=1981512 RepID=A0A6L9SAZ5_9ACTN|nr:carbamoyltransferase C-terminal domain-containing protein [Phytoactinopolyspora halotolerans]NEE02327.1 carbamoyltransferase [Phytoactinopolyspora halotolerans]
MKVLGINAIFHDPAAALVVDGEIVAAAEEERFSRRKHGKRPVPFSAWELPERAARWCLETAGIEPRQLDAVGYSFDPELTLPTSEMGLHDPWDYLRRMYAEAAPRFIATALAGLHAADVQYVAHHVAHAASAGLAAPHSANDVLVLDGRGERASHLAGQYDDTGALKVLATQELPHSLGLMYEDMTEHLGFLRSSDEYKVMAMASYGQPRFSDALADAVYATGDGGFRTEEIDWSTFAPARLRGQDWTADHADLAASVQRHLEDVLVELAAWLRNKTDGDVLTMAGGVALNCVANTEIARRSGYRDVWIQPAAGDAGTALGAALHLAQAGGDTLQPMRGAGLGRSWSDAELAAELDKARLPYERPDDVAVAAADCLAENGVVAWFQGGSEYGPRALGHRSLLAHPGHQDNIHRLNDVKGREQFRPIAPMVLAERAAEIFSRGPIPSPYMLFTHDVASQWRHRIPAVVHVDGTARIQTVDRADEPLVARVLDEFERRTGLPVVVNTSLNTAGRPMVDSPRDALECFGSTPVDLLVLGPYVVRRGAL